MRNIKKRHIVIPITLVLIDQLIKFYIFYGLSEYYDVCTKINGIIRFHPIFNEKVIALNARFGWEIPKEIIIFVAILELLVIILLYWGIDSWGTYIIKGERARKWIDIFIILAGAGILAFLCDQIFIGQTLDYLEIRGIGILDLKDIYLCLGVAGILGLMVLDK